MRPGNVARVVIGVFVMLVSQVARAQRLSTVQAGTLVRVETLDHDFFIGQLRLVAQDSVYLEAYQRDPAITLPLSGVLRYSTHGGRNFQAGSWGGMKVGGGIGLVLVGLGAAADLSAGGRESFVSATAVGVAVGAVLIVLGAVAGTAGAPERWVPAEGAVAVHASPVTAPVTRLGFTVRFD
jgi:hypothetical protein